MWADNTVFTDDQRTIENFISYRSDSMHDYLCKNRDSARFTMWYKSLTHSDLPTRGKRTNSSDGFEKNLLYYMSVEDMISLQEQYPDRKFECAKQSNIGMPENFYNDIGVPRIQRRNGPQKEKHNWICLNDYMSVYLVNDSLQYFSLLYSEKIMNKLNKKMPQSWKSSMIKLDRNNDFTAIDLHEAIHGLGVEADSVFHALRLTMFLNDTIIFIKEHSFKDPKLFILLEKNAVFYSLMGLKDRRWSDEERIRRFQERITIKEGLSVELPDKLYDNEWDDTLLP